MHPNFSAKTTMSARIPQRTATDATLKQQMAKDLCPNHTTRWRCSIQNILGITLLVSMYNLKRKQNDSRVLFALLTSPIKPVCCYRKHRHTQMDMVRSLTSNASLCLAANSHAIRSCSNCLWACFLIRSFITLRHMHWCGTWSTASHPYTRASCGRTCRDQRNGSDGPKCPGTKGLRGRGLLPAPQLCWNGPLLQRSSQPVLSGTRGPGSRRLAQDKRIERDGS